MRMINVEIMQDAFAVVSILIGDNHFRGFYALTVNETDGYPLFHPFHPAAKLFSHPCVILR